MRQWEATMMSKKVVSQDWPRDVSCWDWVLPLLSSPVFRCNPCVLALEQGISAPLRSVGALALMLVEQGFLCSVSDWSIGHRCVHGRTQVLYHYHGLWLQSWTATKLPWAVHVFDCCSPVVSCPFQAFTLEKVLAKACGSFITVICFSKPAKAAAAVSHLGIMQLRRQSQSLDKVWNPEPSPWFTPCAAWGELHFLPRDPFCYQQSVWQRSTGKKKKKKGNMPDLCPFPSLKLKSKQATNQNPNKTNNKTGIKYRIK